ncbi:MAG: copper resistance protein CopC [Gammaproteobacteria bacterium]|nr:copper resistance protein CopC [Gammaproteobacteria bacterium]MDP2141843.1 copper resistance protein CopC [Gammaproteobacteria bacterium]MDP2348334.1 copper resistance protein CopC [Gammaproteobacteria bacterium]
MKRIQLLIAALLLLVMHSTASAHSAMAGSVPANGQTVSSPDQLMLTFDGAVRLVRLTVNSDNGVVDVGFVPHAGAATMFHVPMPPLAAGMYRVNWTILGADGHSVSETFRFTVDPAAPAAAMPDHHSHGAGGDHQH